MKVQTAQFVGSYASLDKLPKRRLPEIAFAGRSNVGKSSLINSLLGKKELARTSSTPGKTRQLNYILVNEAFYFVDLPGYGFARVSQEERRRWGHLIETYVENSPYLRVVVSIIDIRHGPMPSDLELIQWLTSIDRACLVVATKADKLGRGQLAQAERRITHAVEQFPVHGPIFYSAKTGLGKRELWTALESFLE